MAGSVFENLCGGGGLMFTTEDKREFETLAEAEANSAKLQAARHNRDHFGDIASYGYCTTCGYTALRGDCTPVVA